MYIDRLKKCLVTTGIWLMIFVPYLLTFFCERDGVTLGYVIAACISTLTIGNLWSKIFIWLYGDKTDTK